MPTGYTADIKDGIDFKTYAMNCARAFGACVSLRDSPGGGELIPDRFEVSDYHLKAIEKARSELAALEAMTPDELEEATNRAWNEDETKRLAYLEDKYKQLKAYGNMLEKVTAWTPPTPDHADLKEFMRTQIEQSINFDCGSNYHNAPTVRLTGGEWAGKQHTRIISDIQYHEREYAAEKDRVAIRNEWIRALRDSL